MICVGESLWVKSCTFSVRLCGSGGSTTVFAYSLSHKGNILVIVYLSAKHTYTSFVAAGGEHRTRIALDVISRGNEIVDYFSDDSDGLIINDEMALLP